MTIEPSLVTVGRTAAWMAKQLEVALGDVGLTLPQYRLLTFLGGGPERASALADRLDVSRPTLTALVDGVVGRGLVERRTADDDRRAVRHVLTAAGERAVADADAVVAARLADLASHLTESQARRALDGLALWRRALEAAHAPAVVQG